ncbi:hypothetical protein C8A00DRAFT_17470, partial [Chaetomidium leptoderma]
LNLLPTRYDGNLLGGALLGAGMAVSGACPGTVLAQLGVGVKSGRYALCGALLAGVVWSWVVKRRTRTNHTPPPSGSGHDFKGETTGTTTTVYGALGVSRGTVLVGLEAALVLAVAAAVRFTDASAAAARGIPPYFAGLAIVAAQLVSMVLRGGSLLGASTPFEELGGWVWGTKRKYAGVLFSAGVVGGAWAVSQAVPALRPVTEMAVSPARAALGGFLVVFGSRMAGGCTSGHGISGMSLMSISSLVTVAATFGAGGLVGLLMS